ncbi:MAG: tRNA lysidine(34) synthetase TilS [Candidatus Dormibacteria bacterium]
MAAVCAGRPELLPPGSRVVAACSGGPDSQALLHLLAGLQDQLGIHLVAAAHFDHRQRPGSESDAALVQELCRDLGVTFHHAAWPDPPADASEAAAREARYAFLFTAVAQLGADSLAVAHTEDDQAETVMLALLRGAGPDGLAGMPYRRGPVTRPLLGITRARLRAHCEAHGIPFVDDPANLDPRFTRNRVRHELMPVLEGIRPHATQAVAQCARLVWEEREAAEAADGLLWELVGGRSADGEISFERNGPAGWPAPLRRRLLRHAGRILLGRTPGWSHGRLEAAAEALAEASAGKVLELGAGCSLELSRGLATMRAGLSAHREL